MRCPFPVVLLLLCGFATRTLAQPAEQATVTKDKSRGAALAIDGAAQMAERLTRATPEVMATFVVKRFSAGDLQMAAFGVAGADPNSPELAQLSRALSLSTNHIPWDANFDEQKLATMPEGVTTITVRVRAGVSDALSLQSWHEEEVVLRPEAIHGHKIWRVVPDKPETLSAPQTEALTGASIVRRIATMLAHPRQAIQWIGPRLALAQAKEVGLGVFQYVLKQRGKFEFDVDNFGDKIRPFLRDAALLTAPGDAEGRQSFHFNPYLTGKSLDDIKEPSRTVLLSLGKENELDFRYEGKTIIAFADGHIELINAERAKTLRWKP